jgi:hypothetical protein
VAGLILVMVMITVMFTINNCYVYDTIWSRNGSVSHGPDEKRQEALIKNHVYALDIITLTCSDLSTFDVDNQFVSTIESKVFLEICM